MSASRYSRLNPQVQSDLTSIPIPEDTSMQFRNSIPDPVSYDRLNSPAQTSDASQNSTFKSQPQVQVRPNSPTKDGLAYTGFSGDISPKPPKRRRTGNSIYSVASSAWSTTKDFAVSHFNVPKVAAPWEHELSEKQGAFQQPSDTIRYFDHRRQRSRLFVNSTFQFCVTLFFAAALGGTLYGFSTLNTGITDTQKRVFNALFLGLSLCLSANLVSSLKGYAQMMRWRFLASGYRTLQDFELVMQCESQSKAFRLIWAGRTRGRFWPNKTQMLALFWILLNLALQVFVALLGLTVSIDVSEKWVMTSWGLTSVADVSFIGDANTVYLYANDTDSDAAWLAQTATANAWGVTGQDYTVVNITFDTYMTQDQSIYTDANSTLFWYRFVDRSAAKYALTLSSYRTVNATASCTELNVTYGGYAGYQTDNTDDMFWVSWINEDGSEQSYWVDNVGAGSTTWMTNMSSACGPRCAQIYALQSADNITDDVPVPRMWNCLSNVSTIDGTEYYDDSDAFKLKDEQAQILAGAIGWSGVYTTIDADNDTTGENYTVQDLQMVRYPVDSQWSPNGYWEASDMAWLVMKFTAGSLAALDDNGPRVNTTAWTPSPAQVIDVKWEYALLILAGVPGIQLIVLLLVIMFANKAIIKDTSHLSTARLLRPIVDKLGDNGCLLTGDEIAEKLGNIKVIYGVRDPGIGNVPASGAGDDGSIRHIDILEETEGLGYRRGRMPVGRYDGVFTSSEDGAAEEKIGLLSEQGRASTLEACENDGMWWKRRTTGKMQRRLSI